MLLRFVLQHQHSELHFGMVLSHIMEHDLTLHKYYVGLRNILDLEVTEQPVLVVVDVLIPGVGGIKTCF